MHSLKRQQWVCEQPVELDQIKSGQTPDAKLQPAVGQTSNRKHQQSWMSKFNTKSGHSLCTFSGQKTRKIYGRSNSCFRCNVEQIGQFFHNTHFYAVWSPLTKPSHFSPVPLRQPIFCRAPACEVFGPAFLLLSESSSFEEGLDTGPGTWTLAPRRFEIGI